MFLLNEVEGAQFTGESQPDSMIQMFREKLPDSKAVLTLGSEGAVYFDSKVEIRQPIFKTEVIDTTAAGDTFTGFFLAGLLKGFDISETLKIASKATLHYLCNSFVFSFLLFNYHSLIFPFPSLFRFFQKIPSLR